MGKVPLCIRYSVSRSFWRSASRLSILNINQIDVENFYNAKNLNYKFRRLDQRTKVNHLLHAVFQNDLVQCNSSLNVLYRRIAMHPTLINMNVYLSCLSILLLKLKNDSDFQILQLKPIITDFIHFHKAYHKKYSSLYIDGKSGSFVKVPPKIITHDIQVKENFSSVVESLIILLIHWFKSIQLDSLLRSSASEYVFSILQLLNVDYIHLAKSLTPLDLDHYITILRPHIDSATLLQISKESAQVLSPDEEMLSINPYKELGRLSYSGLCKFISNTRFDKFDNGCKKPLYEIYKSLPKSKQLEFMNDYMNFNRKRELTIENHCLHLTSSNSPTHNTYSMQLSKMVGDWISHNVSVLSGLKSKLDTIDGQDKSSLAELSLEETHLLKYTAHLNFIPLPELVNLVINDLLTGALTSKDGHIGAAKFCKSLRSKFIQLVLRDKKNKHIYGQVLKFMTEDDAIEFFSTLIKIMAPNCTINSNLVKDSQVYEARKLIDKVESDNDELFFEKSNDSYPAFLLIVSKQFSKHGKFERFYAIIKIHPYLLLEYQKYFELSEGMKTFLPMLCEPKPWVSPSDGGFLLDLKKIVASTSKFNLMVYINAAHESNQLESTYKALDVLGSTKWIIDTKMLKIFNRILDMDVPLFDIPPHLDKLRIELPDEPKRDHFENDDQFTRYTRRYHRDVALRLKEYHGRRGDRIVLESIRTYCNAIDENGDMFFIPHNVDTRGRAYPMTSIVHHQNSDPVRALMRFWDMKPLGKNGFNWIKYHLAGVYGEDKLTFEDRLKFVDENISNIRESAENPFYGAKWWQNADKPFQTLSYCFEINSILKYIESSSENRVENYLSRAPIHQDGSCNGLQHYAALGANKAGGKAVNLIPGEKKSDVYMSVLNLVKERVHSDFETKKDKDLAKVAYPLLDRKIVKRTVMTSVYGVTNFGAKLQVEERLTDYTKHLKTIRKQEGKALESGVLEDSEIRKLINQLSSYIANHILEAISTLFSEAKSIEHWMVKNCYRIITSYDLRTVKSFDSFDFFKGSYKNMMWTSISGFPVVQQYKSYYDRLLKTPLFMYRLRRPEVRERVDIVKHIHSVAPNFIHSLDATHMMMTALAAHQNNILFASVHDSFWTHPNEVEILSKIIREEFVRMYTSDIIRHMELDLKYTTRNSFQLVWFNRTKHIQFAKQIDSLRQKFLRLTKVKPQSYNKCLAAELENPEKVLSLYNTYKPDVYLIKHNNLAAIYENKSTEKDEFFKISKKDYVPILIPVKILDPPSTGDLEIKEVLNSKYFFS